MCFIQAGGHHSSNSLPLSSKALVQVILGWERSGRICHYAEPIFLQNISTTAAAAATAKSLQSCPTLCDPIDGSPLGSSVPGILRARILEWVAISFSNASKWKVKSESEVTQSCQTLSDPMDCSLPGSSVHGIFPGKSTGVGCHCLLRSTTARVWIKSF